MYSVAIFGRGLVKEYLVKILGYSSYISKKTKVRVLILMSTHNLCFFLWRN